MELLARGETLLELQDAPGAVKVFREAIEIDPTSGEARLGLGRALVANGREGRARAEFIRAGELLPGDPAAQLLAARALLADRRFTDARVTAANALRVAPDSVEARVMLAIATAGLTGLSTSVDEVFQSLSLDPRTAREPRGVAVHLLGRRDQEEAERLLREAVEMAPKDPAVLGELANYFWSVGRLDEAEAVLLRGWRLTPADPALNTALAAFYLGEERPADAERYLVLAAERSNEGVAQGHLADFYVFMAFRENDRLIQESVERLRRREGANAERLVRAAERFAAGSTVRARDLVREVLAVEPGDPDALLLHAQLLLASDDLVESRRALEACLSARPEFVDGYRTLATLNMADREFAGAARALAEVMHLDHTAVDARIRASYLTLAGSPAGAASTGG